MSSFPLIALTMQLPEKTAFTLFNFSIYWNGIFLAVGVLAAIVLAHLDCKRRNMPEDTAVDLCLVALPCGIVGARVVYILLNLSYYLASPVRMLQIWDGGLNLAGAILFALVGIFFYARKKNVRFLKLLDVIAPCIALTLVFSSWGHFFNQDFYGPIVTAKALKWFPLCVRLDSGEIHLAFFFLQFVWMALTLGYLWFYLKNHAKHDGDVAFTFLRLYGFSLAIFSAFRKDSGSFTFYMIVGIVLFAASLLFVLVRRMHEKKIGSLIWPSPEIEQTSEESVSEDTADSDSEEESSASDESENTEPAAEVEVKESAEKDEPSADAEAAAETKSDASAADVPAKPKKKRSSKSKKAADPEKKPEDAASSDSEGTETKE